MAADKIDTIVSLSKRRGFVYPCSEIYGGQRAAWDYGPLGVELKENIKRQWWRYMVTSREDVVGIDSSVILAPEVWVASGHVATFTDPLTECTSCHKRYRADHLEEAYEAKHGQPPGERPGRRQLPATAATRAPFTEPKQFSGLLSTHLGPTQDAGSVAYLRPETAQGIFTNFAQVQQTSRKKPPFGIAQMGKSFRNEITPGNFIFRTREFEQMEMEFFVKPGEDEKWQEYWMEQRWNWYTGLGLREENMRWFEHPKEKLSHYSKRTADIEYRFQLRRQRVGRAGGRRQPHRLRPHRALQGLRPGPVVLRPGGRRALDPVRHRARGRCRPRDAGLPARRVHRGRGAQRQGRHGEAHRACASTRASRRSRSRSCRCPATRELSPKAKGLAADLRQNWNIEFDDAGAIGRRYRRQDEIGTPFCVTVDFDTLDDNAVTVRERDTMKQERVSLDQIEGYLAAACSAADRTRRPYEAPGSADGAGGSCTRAHPSTGRLGMPSMTTSKVSRWDRHGREHVVHVRKSGTRRQLTCETCGWRKGAQFLPWLKAEEHLAEAHQATIDPTA